MSTDSRRWRGCLWLRALVLKWHEARGRTVSDFQRTFSRDWEDLIESAGLTSAESRNESFREAVALQAAGLVELRTVRYRPYQIERVIVPFSAESRLRELFGDELPSAAEPKFDFKSVKWASPLAFLITEIVTVASDDLLKLNDFLLKQPQAQPIVPIKERSLEVFGDEKRLDALLSTSLFRKGRLDWEKDLRCEIVGEPLGWKRGPAGARTQPVIVIENAATWHSYCRLNAERKLFGAVVYGCGNRFVDGIRYLNDVFDELGGPRRVLYFGDLDPRGVEIPQEAAALSQGLGLPVVEPHLWSYRQLLKLGTGRGQPWDGEQPSPTLCDWLGELADPVRLLFKGSQRLAQEHVGWEFLKSCSSSSLSADCIE